jgi:hypothetical protein
MNLNIELTEIEPRALVYSHLASKLGDVSFDRNAVKIEVKSKQNHKSEWESAAFRATLQVIA